jgi:hypothetical protein
MKSKVITTKIKVSSEVNEDGRDCLSESHRDYIIRFVEFEDLRQQRVSDKFLRERFKPSASQAE